MPVVVTGISQSANPSAVEGALRSAGFSIEPLIVYVGGEEPEGHADSGLRFVDTDTDSIRDMLRTGSGGIYSTGGGSVPGLELGSSPEFFRRETLDEELSELDIPDSELENYEEALEAGRALFAYFARPETVAPIEAIFRDAGLANVRTF